MTVYVSEYGGYAPGPLQIAQEPPLVEYVLTPSTSGVTSTRAFDPATNYIRIHTDGIISFGVVASTTLAVAITNKRMAASATEYFGVTRQTTANRLSVITNS